MRSAPYPDTYYARRLGAVPRRARLQGMQQAATCVIGGGLAGVATALDLAERGHDVVLLEQRQIGWGASGRNGGFVSDGFQREVAEIERRVGPDQAREMLALSRAGVDLLKQRLDRLDIACGPRTSGVMRVALRGRDAGLQAWRDHMARDHATEWAYWPSARVGEALATDRYADALVSQDGFAVDPLAMTRGLAAAAERLGMRIFEQTRVRRLGRRHGGMRVLAGGGEVHCENVVIAGGGYVGPQFPKIWGATVPVASFVMTTPPLGERLRSAIGVPFAIYDLQFATNYYRRLPDGGLLWGGRVLGWQPGADWIERALRHDMQALYPGLKGVPITVAWSGLMPFLSHYMPVVTQLMPGLWVATGFGGHGLALTTMAGRLLGSAIADGDDRWRMFAAYGLPFAGGALSRVPAQMVFWHRALEQRRAA